MLKFSFCGSVETLLTSGVCLISAVESSQTADDTETWTDVIAYRDKSSLYATAPRSKVSIATLPFYAQSITLHSQPQNRVWLRSRNLICTRVCGSG